MTDKPYIDEEGTLHYSGWVSNGSGMSYNRDCLSPKDPEQTYNYLKANGIIPEHYGIRAYDYPQIRKLSRLELIDKCIEQQNEIDAMMRSGMF